MSTPNTTPKGRVVRLVYDANFCTFRRRGKDAKAFFMCDTAVFCLLGCIPKEVRASRHPFEGAVRIAVSAHGLTDSGYVVPEFTNEAGEFVIGCMEQPFYIKALLAGGALPQWVTETKGHTPGLPAQERFRQLPFDAFYVKVDA